MLITRLTFLAKQKNTEVESHGCCFLSHVNLTSLSSVGYFTRRRLEVTPVVSEGLPGAVTTANSTQVVWCGVVWIVNERRWQCRVPPQEELCRMPYVLCFGRYRVVSHDASVNPPPTLQMFPTRRQRPSLHETACMEGNVLCSWEEFSYVWTHRVLLLLDWQRCIRWHHSPLPAGGGGGGAFRQASRTQRWEDHIVNVIGYPFENGIVP